MAIYLFSKRQPFAILNYENSNVYQPIGLSGLIYVILPKFMAIDQTIVIIFIHRISHGKNESQQTDMYTRKILIKTKEPQPYSGQVPTYYNFVTLTQKYKDWAEQLHLSYHRKFLYVLMALATNMLHSLFSDTNFTQKFTSAICNYWWRMFALWTVPAVKILNLKKSKMAEDCDLEIKKIAISQQWFGQLRWY